MRRTGRELWEISKIWWLVVPGGALGIVAIVQAIKDVHGKSVWFWGFLAMAALLFAVGWRLRSVLEERDQAKAVLGEEGSRDAVAHRLNRFIHEHELLAAERPPEQDGVGPVRTDEQDYWIQSVNHLTEQISSELRQNAPEFVSYWRSNPEDLPPTYPFERYADAFVAMSIRQLRHITERLQAGHDEP
jgi:hypothetical protein